MRSNALLMLLAVMLSFAACKKDEDPTTNPVVPSTTMSAKINNVLWYAGDIQMGLVNGGYSVFGSRSPTTGKTSSVLLSVKHYGGLSTYTIDTANTAVYTENNVPYFADSGSIAILTDNAVHTAGNFSFTAEDSNNVSTKTITTGSFDIYK